MLSSNPNFLMQSIFSFFSIFTVRLVFSMNFIYQTIFIFIGIILSGLLFIRKDNPNYLKAFCPFLTLGLSVEYIANFLATKSIHTLPIYNIFGVIEFCFYLWVFYNIIKNRIAKKVITGLFVLFPAISFLNILFLQGINNFNSITYSIGCLMIIFLCVYYFLELFRTQIYLRLSNDPAFWICTALLFYYCVSFPVFVSTNLMKHFTHKLGELIAFVLMIMNIVLYSLFCVAFVCQLKFKKELSV